MAGMGFTQDFLGWIRLSVSLIWNPGFAEENERAANAPALWVSVGHVGGQGEHLQSFRALKPGL